jgi:hypothetical protein
MIFYDEQGVSNIKRDARTKSIELDKHMLEKKVAFYLQSTLVG